MYAYPGHVSDELVEVMAAQPKIVPYLDMPLQHGDARTLRRMRRPSRLEMVYDHSAAPDKEFVAVEGANHSFQPCRPEFGDTRTRTFDFVDAWLSKPGRF